MTITFVAEVVGTGATVTTPVPAETWRAVHRRDPDALPTQTPEWIQAIVESGPWRDVSRLYELDGRQFVLPIVERRGAGMGLIASSLPLAWEIGGVVGDGVDHRVVDVVVSDLANARWGRVSIYPNPLQARAWAAAARPCVVSIPRRAHVIDLSGGRDAVWGRLSRSRRRRVQRTLDAMPFEIDRDDGERLLPVYYGLYAHSLDHWSLKQNEPRALTHLRGRIRDPLRKFQAVARQLRGKLRTTVAWRRGEPIAAQLTLFGDQHAVGFRAVMNWELAGQLNVVPTLDWLDIESAVQRGAGRFHFGETGASASLADYKESLGASSFEHYEHHIERFPITAADRVLRSAAKRLVGFDDASRDDAAPAEADQST